MGRGHFQIIAEGEPEARRGPWEVPWEVGGPEETSQTRALDQGLGWGPQKVGDPEF